MKSLTLTLSLFIAYFVNVLAGNILPQGSYILAKASAGEKSQDIYSFMSFNDDGSVTMNKEPIGTWRYDKRHNTLTVTSEALKTFDGTWKVSKDNSYDLLLKKDATTLFFIKPGDAENNNANSGLEGIWELQSEYGESTLALNPDGSARLIYKEGDVTTTTEGTWLFLPKRNSLLLLTNDRDFKGEYLIKDKGEKTLTLSFNNETLKGTKKEQSTQTNEELTWKDDDFYTPDGDFKYMDDENKLPWTSEDEIWNTYSGLTKLVYIFSKLVDKDMFEISEVSADIDIDDKLDIPDIFSGNDGDKKVSYDRMKYIFPINCNVFRVTGTEQLATPAGTFDCTVIEGMGDFDEKIKIWMINDKPGIVAKVIKQKDDGPFGHYYVYELKEIDIF